MNEYIRRKKQYNYDGKRPFVKLADLEIDKAYTIIGFFISNGKYGETPVMVLDDVNVNLPTYTLKSVRGIIADPDATVLINNRGLIGVVYEYTAHDSTHRGIYFVED